MTPKHSVRPQRQQRGITMLGLLFWSTLIVFFAVLLIKSVPTYFEFKQVQILVNKAAVIGGNTVPDVRARFETLRQQDGTVDSMTAANLDITKENDRVVITFAYDKQIELFGPISLLIKYRGRSQP
jgi:hypothetical protein